MTERRIDGMVLVRLQYSSRPEDVGNVMVHWLTADYFGLEPGRTYPATALGLKEMADINDAATATAKALILAQQSLRLRRQAIGGANGQSAPKSL